MAEAIELSSVMSASGRLGADTGTTVTRQHGEIRSVELQTMLQCAPGQLFGLLSDYAALPTVIAGLESAQVLSVAGNTTVVEFALKLPFPFGRITWTNAITSRKLIDGYAVEWSLVRGDLKHNDGRVLLTSDRSQPNTTRALYCVRVASKARLPRAVERFATRWLLPRIISQLRKRAGAL